MDNKTKLDYFRTGLLIAIFIVVIIFAVIIFRNAKEVSSHPLRYAAESLGEGTECSCLVPSTQGTSKYSFNKTIVMFYEDAFAGTDIHVDIIKTIVGGLE